MNVILLAIDTLRADHLSCYGYHRLTSPHLDRIARQGTLFSECFSPHIPTHPGFTTIMTGKDVFTHQIVAHGGKRELDPAVRTLAEILREQGYRTAAADNLGRWFSRGFEVYEVYRWPLEATGPWRKAEVVNEKALVLLDQLAAQSQPFFLFLHYWDPHTPYLPPPPFDRMFYYGNEKDPENRSMDPVWAVEPFRDYFAQWMGGVTDIRFPEAQYDAEIAYCDATLARLFTALEHYRLLENTLLVILADHGEVLADHVCYFDHHGLYDANLHVPLILHCPGRIPEGRRIDGFVRLLDVAPTILDFLGLGDLAHREKMEGQSLLPLLGRSPGDRRGVCSEIYLTECTWMRKRGLRTHEWKIIQALEPDFHNLPPIELYHLPSDPGEQVNLATVRPEVVEWLLGRLRAWVERRTAETGQPDPLETQSITLRRIGALRTAVPENQRL
jgi:arylsulfatase A-like enzyme